MLLGGAGRWVFDWGGLRGCEDLLIWFSFGEFASSFLFISEVLDTCEDLNGCFA